MGRPAQAMSAPPPADAEAHRRLLRAYAQGFRTGDEGHDANVDLKLVHCLYVMDEARAILDLEQDALDLDSDDRAICLLAALYHDVGRFEQLRRFHTFDDSRSVNHGAMGSRVLGVEPFLDGLSPLHRCRVRAAVAVHNRRFFPRAMEPDAALATRVVRDADKLDIYRVMIGHLTAEGGLDPVVTLGVTPHPERYTPELLRAVLAGRQGDYRLMAWSNDFKLLLLSWVYTMHFPAARKALARRGHVAAILATLPDDPGIRELSARLAEHLEDPGGGPGSTDL